MNDSMFCEKYVTVNNDDALQRAVFNDDKAELSQFITK